MFKILFTLLIVFLIQNTFAVPTGSTGTVNPTTDCGEPFNYNGGQLAGIQQPFVCTGTDEGDICHAICTTRNFVNTAVSLVCTENGDWIEEVSLTVWNSSVVYSPCSMSLYDDTNDKVAVESAFTVDLVDATTSQSEVDYIVNTSYEHLVSLFNNMYTTRRRLLDDVDKPWTLEMVKELVDIDLEVGSTVMIITIKDTTAISAQAAAGTGDNVVIVPELEVSTDVIDALIEHDLVSQISIGSLVSTMLTESDSFLVNENIIEPDTVMIDALTLCEDGTFQATCPEDNLVNKIIDKASEEAWIILLVIMAVMFCCIVLVAWKSHDDKHKKFHDVELDQYMQNQNQYLAPQPAVGAPSVIAPSIVAPTYVEGGHTQLPVAQEQVHITIG